KKLGYRKIKNVIKPCRFFIFSTVVQRHFAEDVPKIYPRSTILATFSLLNGQNAVSCLDDPCGDYAYMSGCNSCYDRFGATKVMGWVNAKLRILLSTFLILFNGSDVTTLFFCGESA
ncbi:uncharacterized protein Bfra_006240, partial [Botrytis fragariae]